MKRLLPIALGLAASALTLSLLMPTGCQEPVRGRIFTEEERLPPCPQVSSRIGIDYPNHAIGSWASNLAATLAGISVGVLVDRRLGKDVGRSGMNRAAILLLILPMLISLASPAGAAIKIRRINFNPPGADSGTNRHLNREHVYLVNTGPKDVQLRGWKVVDRGRDHVYRFSRLFLFAGETIHLRTGSGSDGAPVCEQGTGCDGSAHYDLHWGLDNYVWNNDGDRARLIRPNGDVADACAYTASASSPKAC